MHYIFNDFIHFEIWLIRRKDVNNIISHCKSQEKGKREKETDLPNLSSVCSNYNHVPVCIIKYDIYHTPQWHYRHSPERNLCLRSSSYWKLSCKSIPSSDLPLYTSASGAWMPQPLALQGSSQVGLDLKKSLYLAQCEHQCFAGYGENGVDLFGNE